MLDRDRCFEVAAVVVVVAAALVLRYGTNILEKPAIFDEVFILGPVADLVHRGWSVETAIDFSESKGPTVVWTYALGARVVGPGLNDMRLISLLLFAAGAIPLVLLCRVCGLRGPPVVLVAVLYVLVPQNAVLGQLFMSEALSVFGSLLLMWIFVSSFGTSRSAQTPVAGPLLFAIVLSILLHGRIHAVALGAAAMLVAFERDRLQSWPWLVACAAAALLRVPLWIRWGGPVAPEFQGLHAFGLALDSLTYLLAALVPFTAIFLLSSRAEVSRLSSRAEVGRRTAQLVAACAGVAALIAIFAQPLLAETLTNGRRPDLRFMGFVATGARAVTASSTLHAVIVGGLASVGAASLGALASVAWHRPLSDRRGVVLRLTVWTLACGCAAYAFTRGHVFDRYLLGWAALLPIAWVVALPRAALALQTAALFAILAFHTWRQLL